MGVVHTLPTIDDDDDGSGWNNLNSIDETRSRHSDRVRTPVAAVC